VLYDGDTMLCESGAVVQYILEKYGNGRLQPAIGSAERAAYLYWFHYSEASAAVPINQYIGIAVYGGEAEKYADLVERAKQGTDRILDRVEAAIKGRSFLVGDTLTGADIMMGFTLWSARMLKLLGVQACLRAALYGRAESQTRLRQSSGRGTKLSANSPSPPLRGEERQ
jgi:glutathione S-transferase